MKLFFGLYFLLFVAAPKEEASLILKPLIEAYIEFEGSPPSNCEEVRRSPAFFITLKNNAGQILGCKNLKSKPVEGAGFSKWGIFSSNETKTISYFSEKIKLFEKPERQQWEKIPLGQAFARLLGKAKRIWRIEKNGNHPQFQDLKSFGGNLLGKSIPHGVWKNGTLAEGSIEGTLEDAISRFDKNLPGWIIDIKNNWVYEVKIADEKTEISFFSLD